MCNALVDADNTATSIEVASKADLDAWRVANIDAAPWLAALGFAGEPGAFGLVPTDEGKAARVIAAPNEGAAIWSLAHLPTTLPEGVYQLSNQVDVGRGTDIALGWVLGSNSFSRYTKPKRKPARLGV